MFFWGVGLVGWFVWGLVFLVYFGGCVNYLRFILTYASIFLDICNLACLYVHFIHLFIQKT